MRPYERHLPSIDNQQRQLFSPLTPDPFRTFSTLQPTPGKTSLVRRFRGLNHDESYSGTSRVLTCSSSPRVRPCLAASTGNHTSWRSSIPQQRLVLTVPHLHRNPHHHPSDTLLHISPPLLLISPPETTDYDIQDVLLTDPGGESKTIRAQFWDTAPGAILAGGTSTYSDALCVLIVYDLTNYDSFAAASSVWYQHVSKAAPDSFTMLIGCKTDLHADRVVSVKEAEALATRHNLFFMEVSAVDGTNIQLTLSILRIRALHTLKYVAAAHVA